MSTYDISSIIDPNVFKDFKKLQEESVKYNDTLAKIHKSTVALSDGLKKTEKSEKKLYAAQKESNASLKQLEAAIKKKTIAEKEAGKQIIKLRTETQKLNKDTKRQIQLEEAAKGSYRAIELQLQKNIQKFKALSQAERENTKAGKQLQKDIYKQQGALKKLDATMNQHQRHVGHYKEGLKGIATSLVGALGVVGGMYAFVSIMRKAISRSIQFEKIMSQVKAITGATNEEFESLTASAKMLGRETSKTAYEVAELQAVYAKMGYSTAEILNATKATIKLAEATGEDLATSAEVAGSTIKAMGLEASDTQMVVDLMAKSFTSSNLNLERWGESMKMAAPIAKAAGIGIKDVAKYLSVLADAGIHGSLAGTALKKIFSELKEEGKPLSKTIKDLADENINLAKAKDLVGDRAKAALLVLTSQTGQLDKLKEAYSDVSGEAEKMAGIATDNVAGAIDKLTSAWEGLTLEVNKSGGALKGTISWMATTLNWFTDAMEADFNVMAMMQKRAIDKTVEHFESQKKVFEKAWGDDIDIFGLDTTEKKLEKIGNLIATSTAGEEQIAFYKAKQIELIQQIVKERQRESQTINKIVDDNKTAYTEITEAKWKEVAEILYAEETLFIAKRDGMAKLNELQQEYSDQEKARIRERYNLTQALFSSAMELGSVYTTLRVAQLKKEGASEEEVAKIKKDGLIFEKSMAAAQAWVSYFAAIPAINNAAAKMDAAAPGTGVAYQIAEHALQLTAAIAATAQIAAVAIPEFDKGTNFAPDLFIAGEKRPEFMNFGGKTQLIEKPTLFSGFKGAEIISSEDTAKIINNRGYDSPELMNELKGLRSDIRNKTEYYFNFRKGTISSRKGSRYTNYINRLI